MNAQLIKKLKAIGFPNMGETAPSLQHLLDALEPKLDTITRKWMPSETRKADWLLYGYYKNGKELEGVMIESKILEEGLAKLWIAITEAEQGIPPKQHPRPWITECSQKK